MYRPEFFGSLRRSSWVSVMAETHPCEQSSVIPSQGSIFPQADLLVGLAENRGALWCKFHGVSTFCEPLCMLEMMCVYLLLCSPQIYLSGWIKRLFCFPTVRLPCIRLVIKYFQLVIRKVNMIHTEMGMRSRKVL